MERENNMFMNESNNNSFLHFQMQNEQHGTSQQLQNCFLNPNWDNSIDQNNNTLFESALSSMVSSPVTSNNAPASSCENVIVMLISDQHREKTSPHSYMHGNNNNNSTTNSCYSTPMNSPPKLNLTMMDHQMRENFGNLLCPGSLGPIVPEPGFVERAARYSCFANNGGNGESSVEVSGYQRMAVEENKNGSSSLQEEKSSLSDQNGGNSRKRKAVSRGKGKDVHSSISCKEANDAAEKNELSAKRSKTEEDEKRKDGTENGKHKKENKDDQKDYIHVRARRGQATDAHSLAERVRREKISQKMKFLQDLVPGCNKVTGKAVMLDEIINYVQSLQRQVEFLSMKLATINPGMEVNIEALLSSKDMLHSRGSLLNGPYPSDNAASAFPFQSQQVPNLHAANPNVSEMPLLPSLLDSAMGRSRSMQEPLGNYREATTQASSVWEDDLQSVVFGQNQTHNFYGLLATGAEMKVEK